MTNLSVVLKDFVPLTNSAPIPQEEFLKSLPKMLSDIQSHQKNITDVGEVFNQLKADVGKYGVSSNYISKRELNAISSFYSEDTHSLNVDKFVQSYKDLNNNYQGLDLGKRLLLYEELVANLLDKWYENPTSLPDDIIHATATGYISPSPVQKLLSKKGWQDITVTHSYHMGCYGAIPPLRMAVGFLASSYAILPTAKKQIDVLHTEYSSLHNHPTKCEPAQIVSMSLFGDGFMKYSIHIDKEEKYISNNCLKVLAFQDRIIPSSTEDMSLIPGPYGFIMSLSKDVPLRICTEIYDYIVSLCSKCGWVFDDIKDDIIYALHPGGPKILDGIRDVLEIDEKQIRHSRKILYEHGNMASTTLPYIWREIINDPEITAGTKIISIAFGPGLTVTGVIFEKI